MNWQFVLLWSLVAIVFPFFLYRTLPDPPIDPVLKPQPQPWQVLISGALGIAGGIIGGWGFYSTWVGHDRISGLEAASTVVGAYLGARLLTGVYLLATQRQSTRAQRSIVTR